MFLLRLFFFLQAYTGAPPTDEKEKIIWVRFEKADINGMNSWLKYWKAVVILCVYTDLLI